MGEGEPDVEKEFPHLHAWMQRLMQKESVKKVMADRVPVLAAAAAKKAAQDGK